MTRSRMLCAFLMLVIFCASIPVNARASAPQPDIPPCHQTSQSEKTDFSMGHADCENCTMGCCVAQIPVTPVFVAQVFHVALFFIQTLEPEGIVRAPLIGPPRA